MTTTDTAHRREALRQQLLLRVLWRDADSGVLQGHARPLGAHALKAGVAAYRGNAGAVAERALAGTFATLAELVGDDAAGALARDFWHHHPPARGDLAEWGDALPGFVAASPQLADEPYLADVAQLEWLVHRASRAADAPPAAPDLQALAGADPARLRLLLAPGTALVPSRWPVAAIWLAHRQPAHDDTRFSAVREAFASQRNETALVWRDGAQVRVAAVDPADAAFVQTLLDGQPLADALDAAGADFAFDRWLAGALASGLLAAFQLAE
jgi:Putative DNA-binding domain